MTEYSEKPTAPPPLSIIFLLWRFCSWVRLLCVRHNETSLPVLSDDVDDLEASLDRFEEKHTETYLERRKADQDSSVETRLERLDEGLHHARLAIVDLQAMSRRQETRLMHLLHSQDLRLTRQASFVASIVPLLTLAAWL